MSGEMAGFEAAVKWLNDRRRADCQLNIAPLQGFGVPAALPAGLGQMTLWLPEPEGVQGRVTFKDGKAVKQDLSGANSVPALVDLRNRVLAGLGGNAVDGITADLCFLDYAAALIRAVYNVTDDELGELLAGSKWHQHVIQHVMGGEDLLERLTTHAPQLAQRLMQPYVQAEPDPQQQPAARRSWWRFW